MPRQPGATGLFGRLALGPLLLGVVATGTLLVARSEVAANGTLLNGGFESWNGDAPANWSVLSGTPSRETARSASGTSLHLSGAQPEGVVQQIVAASAGSTVAVDIRVSSDTAVDVTLAVYPLDDSFLNLGLPTTTLVTAPAGEGFMTVSETTAPLPAGTAYVRMQVSARLVTGSTLSVYFDDASLVETVAMPTPTATPTEAAVQTATPVSTSPAGVEPTATAAPGHSPTKTPTVRPTPTTRAASGKTPTKAPTMKPQPTPRKTATPTPRPHYTPTPSNPEATSSGLLLNGDFEALDNGKPAYWTKYGGDMGATGEAYAGKWSATLSSTTSSTKWLSQVVTVVGGGWYDFRAVARTENVEAFLRVSWYTSEDGSGSQLDASDGSSTSSGSWSALDTGPIQAPPASNSARVKLMLRPNATSGRAIFDDAWFAPAEAPPATATPAPHETSTASPTTARTKTPTRTPTPKRSSGSGAAATKTPSSPGASGSGNRAAPVAHIELSPGGTLRLSEFMSDPPRSGSDGPDEWVEVVNTGTSVVSTAGWHIGDATSSDEIPAVEVPPGSYLIIAGKTALLPDSVLVVRVADGSIGNGLNNNGDVITLSDASGTTVDAISFGANASIFEPAPPAPPAGGTTGVHDPSAEPATENWELTLKPSPGAPNVFAEAAPVDSSPGAQTTVIETDERGAGEAAPIRQLQPAGERNGTGFGTLDWIVVGALLMGIGAGLPVLTRRFGRPLWERIHRKH